ncbi:hypothetical protein LZ31DRAFT_165961 [Colletotrichum somersetense]|nr:hypothetical protein LZ31DRAFT_165961 [Colletotrichum somersetense]
MMFDPQQVQTRTRLLSLSTCATLTKTTTRTITNYNNGDDDKGMLKVINKECSKPTLTQGHRNFPHRQLLLASTVGHTTILAKHSLGMVQSEERRGSQLPLRWPESRRRIFLTTYVQRQALSTLLLPARSMMLLYSEPSNRVMSHNLGRLLRSAATTPLSSSTVTSIPHPRVFSSLRPVFDEPHFISWKLEAAQAQQSRRAGASALEMQQHT